MFYSIIVIGLIIGMQLFSRTSYFHYYIEYFFPIYKNTVGRICDIIPYSVFQWVVPALIIGLVYLLFKNRKIVVPYLLTIFLVYTCTCGAIYNRTDIKETNRSITQEQIDALTRILLADIENLEFDPLTVDQILELSPSIMNNHEAGYYPHPKKVIGSSYMSEFNITGIYSPFTIEANVNIDSPIYDLPFTACHELSHLNGYMKEEQANFNAYKACVESDQDFFKISAYMQVIHKLSAHCSFSFTLPEYFYTSRIEMNEYWENYDGWLSDVEQQVNDTYLQINGDTGTVSYSYLIYDLIDYYGL